MLLDEIASILPWQFSSMATIRRYLDALEKFVETQIFQVLVPTAATYLKAIEITQTGNHKSGFPEFSDALYHALALQNEAVLLTHAI